MRNKAKLIKIESLKGETWQTPRKFTHREYVKAGDILEGSFTDWPQVGFSFGIMVIGKGPIFTSEVMEIVDDRVFKTRNSLYRIVTIEDERDNKIKIIIEE